MNDLEYYFDHNPGYQMYKSRHFFEAYDRHFARFRQTDVCVLEFGVSHGGSLQMWRHYFGANATIAGVDINPQCRQMEAEGFRIFIGDQGDRAFLRQVADALPRIDIVIDDGGHTMEQQITTFEEFYPRLASNGIYLCEDTHTSYHKAYGGGLHRRGTFIEYSKQLIDRLYAHPVFFTPSEPPPYALDAFSQSTYAMYYYPALVFVEKRPMALTAGEKTGQLMLPPPPDVMPTRYPWLRGPLRSWAVRLKQRSRALIRS